MVMTIMVIIIPPTTAAVGSKGYPHDRRGVPGATTRAMAAAGELAPGSGLERRADYSVFYGQ